MGPSHLVGPLKSGLSSFKMRFGIGKSTSGSPNMTSKSVYGDQGDRNEFSKIVGLLDSGAISQSFLDD